MGTVWLARDTLLGRDVAMKDVTGQGERVLREARAAARVVHPNVVTVYDVVEHDDRQWIVMQHVESRTLADVISVDGPLPPERAAEIGLDLVAALRAAHESGVLHRDVKPGNVLLDATGRAHLADFGIASAEGDSSITAAGVLVGAPSYMAPERVRGLESGPESDFWSLGVTIYAAVEGIVPFDRGDPLATMTSVLTDAPPAPTRAGWLAPLLTRLMDKDPAARPSADEIVAALSGSFLVQPTTPLPPAAPVQARHRRRAPMAVGAVATVAAAAVAGLLFLLRPTDPPAHSQTPAVVPPASTSSSQSPVQIAPVRTTHSSTATTTAATTATSSTTTTPPPTTTTVAPTTTTTTPVTTTTTAPESTTTAAAGQTSVSPTS
ncbi:serine/threonine protein kinase [Kutzneria buriramensis]|uniref:non-specific serine/threonine protein kinase n=2 Tax=Kutzneria buriramensis TaxID=1045776 RepID=A0A3E0I5A7_9PSEU|nr:serine/threonine protein kinase [Kutzneria buriramensis]